AATTEPAKTSVTALRRQAMDVLENEEAAQLFKSNVQRPRSKVRKAKKSAADVGTAYHRFLENVSLDFVGELKQLRAEAERMEGDGVLTADEIEWLDFDSLLKFWKSDIGKKIVANASAVRRELAFTARFSRAELATASGQAVPARENESGEEFIIVQG